MLKSINLYIFLFVSFVSNGQEAISFLGGSYSNANSKIDFTIGETVTKTSNSGFYTLTQGFHQSNWSLISVEEKVPDFEAIVFPNPTSDFLNISTKKFQNINYRIFDVKSNLIATGLLLSYETQIQVNHFLSGTYFLILYSNSKKLKVFQLYKL